MNRLRSMLHIAIFGRRIMRRIADQALLDRMCYKPARERKSLLDMMANARAARKVRYFHAPSRTFVRR